MGVLWVKHQISWHSLVPGGGVAVGVLGGGPAAVSDDVLATADVVKHPIHKARTVQAIGPVGARGGTARRRDLPDRAPCVVPAQRPVFDSDR